MLKVVFDTSIFISAFITPLGNAEEAFLLAIRQEIDLYTSIEILTETANKLKKKFDYPDYEIDEFILLVREHAVVTKPVLKLSILKDEPDNRILEYAEHIHADFIVTGDKHLLNLKAHKKTKIIRLADFLKSDDFQY